MEAVQLLGSQGPGSTRYEEEPAARTTGNMGPVGFFLASSCSVQVGVI